MGFLIPEAPFPEGAQWSDYFAFITFILIATRKEFWKFLLTRRSFGDIGVFVYILWAIVSAIQHGGGYAKLLGMMELSAIYFMAAFFMRSDGSEQIYTSVYIQKFTKAWILGTALLCVTAVAGSILMLSGVPTLLSSDGGQIGFTWRPKGLSTHPNMLASLCLFSIFVLSAKQIADPLFRKSRIALLALHGLTFTLILPRTVLSLITGFALYSWPKDKKKRKLSIAVLLVIIVVTVVSMRFIVAKDGAFTFSKDTSRRARILEASWQTAIQNPVFGVGPGVSAATVSPEPGLPLAEWDAHQTFVDVAATLGIPGLIAFLMIILPLFSRALKVSGDTQTSQFARILSAVFLAYLFESIFTSSQDFRHLWLVMGLLSSINLNIRNDHDS